ncbi:MAG: HEAT repeat domain-containing protein [Planctomycetota bacterium]
MLIESLKDKRKSIHAASALGAIGDRSAVPALIDSVTENRNYHAAEALGRMKAREAIPRLIEAVNSGKYPSLAASAAWALGEIGAKEALPHLRAVFAAGRDPSDIKTLTFQAAVALKKLSGSLPEEALDLLEHHLRGYFKNVPTYIRILAESGDADFAPLVVECLTTDYPYVRSAAAAALKTLTAQDLGEDYVAWRLWFEGRRHGGRVPPRPPELDRHIGQLAGEDSDVVVSAVVTLGDLGDVRAIPALEKLYAGLPDRPVALRAEALRALALMGKRNAVDRLMRLVKDRATDEQRIAVLDRMAGIEDDRVPSVLRGLWREASVEVKRSLLRVAASSARFTHLFKTHRDTGVVEMADEALFVEDPTLWREGAEALSAMFGVTLLPEGIHDPGPARSHARRRWASFVVEQALEAALLRQDDPPPAKKRGSPFEDRGSPARRVFDWVGYRGEQYLPELVALLVDDRPLVKRTYFALRNYEDEILDLPTVSELALRALRNVRRLPPNPQVERRLFEKLRSPDEKVALKAAGLLAWFDDPETVERLLAAWRKSEDRREKHLLGRALLASSSHVDAFRKAFETMYAAADQETRGRAIELLKGGLLPAMWEDKKETYVKTRAVRTRRYLDAGRLPEPVEKRLRAEFESDIRPLLTSVVTGAFDLGRKERLWAVRTVGGLRIRTLTPKVISSLSDEWEAVQRSAIKSLAKMKARETIPHIEPFLDNEKAHMRAEAARALGELRARASLGKLRRLLQDEHFWPAAEAARALARMGDRESASAVAALLDGEPQNLVHWQPVIEAAAALGAREAIPKLREMVETSAHGRMEHAIEALGSLGGPEEVEFMENLVTARQGPWRAAFRAAGRIGGPKARRMCRTGIGSDNDPTILAAAEGLALAGDRLGYEILVEFLGTRYFQEARRALVGLVGQDFGPPENTDSRQEYRRCLRAWHRWWKENRERVGEEFDE